jgi:hypothetical protein
MIKKYKTMKEIYQSSQQNPISAHYTGTLVKNNTTHEADSQKRPVFNT